MRRTVIAVALGLAAAACGSGGGTKASRSPTAPTPQARPSSSAKLGVTEPTNGQAIKGSTVHVKMTLTGASIVPVTSQVLKPNEGHVHLTLDRKLVTMTAQLQADIPDVKPGAHVLHVEFVASDHAPFDPRVIVDVAFTTTA